MSPFIQVVTTMPDQAGAKQLASQLLKKRLAACVQISPCTSWYHWQESIEQSPEVICSIKSRSDLFDEVREMILSLHPYEIPEVLVFQVEDGSASYLEWMNRELQPLKERP